MCRGDPLYSDFKHIADQDRYRNEKVRCATVVSEKLRLRRRTAASSKDGVLYRKDLNQALKCFLLSPMSRSLKSTSQQDSSHSVHPSARRQTVCRCDSHESLCRPGPQSAPLSSPLVPVRRGSGDDLRLPGLARHLGATLRDDWRACRRLAVQAEAADHVLQSRAFRLPLLSGLFVIAGLHLDL